MEGVFWGVLVGFFLGSFGYVLSRFIVTPLLQYGKIKRRLAADLRDVAKSGERESLTDRDVASIARLHQHARVLTRHVEEGMPLWFRLSLERRNEQPLAAAAELMTLANIRTPEHLGKRVARVRELLGLPAAR